MKWKEIMYEKVQSITGVCIDPGHDRRGEHLCFGTVSYTHLDVYKRQDIYSRPSSGEPRETIAAELAPKIDAKIKELYEA